MGLTCIQRSRRTDDSGMNSILHTLSSACRLVRLPGPLEARFGGGGVKKQNSQMAYATEIDALELPFPNREPCRSLLNLHRKLASQTQPKMNTFMTFAAHRKICGLLASAVSEKIEINHLCNVYTTAGPFEPPSWRPSGKKCLMGCKRGNEVLHPLQNCELLWN